MIDILENVLHIIEMLIYSALLGLAVGMAFWLIAFVWFAFRDSCVRILDNLDEKLKEEQEHGER